MAAEIDRLIQKSSDRESESFVTPSIAAVVIGRNGKTLYEQASGVGSKLDEPLTLDHVFWLASQSKMMCTVACMIALEQGLIGLDDDVGNVLPDLAKLEVLDGGKDANGVPTTRPRKNKITLRLLLSHQSGVGYDLMPLSLIEWAKSSGLKATTLDSTQIAMKHCPLAFEPGTDWCYGAGIDWAGELVARLTEMPLEKFYAKHIWTPLGMKATTFHPTRFENSIVQPVARDAEGNISVTSLQVPREPSTETAGHGVWGSPRDYVKLLQVLLDGGQPLLTQASVNEIFKPQLKVPSSILPQIHGVFKPVLGPSIPLGEVVDHGLAGLINTSDFPRRRHAGTLQWSGMPNLIWWVDQKAGIAATAFLQLMPPGDPKAIEFNIRFEKAVYRAFDQQALGN